MPSSWVFAIVSVALVSLLSLIGLTVITLSERRLRQIIFLMVAVATGSLFGDAFLDLLPASYLQKDNHSGSLALTGVLVFFVLERFLRWQHGHALEPASAPKTIGYMNITADGIHNFTDGLIIGVSYLASIKVGVATTLAVMFHEIPHEFGNFFVLLYAGFSKRRALLLNFLSALAAIAGTALALLIGSRLERLSASILPFAAGGFIYIAGSDLLPELHKETDVRRSLFQLIAMAAGVGIILGLNLWI